MNIFAALRNDRGLRRKAKAMNAHVDAMRAIKRTRVEAKLRELYGKK